MAALPPFELCAPVGVPYEMYIRRNVIMLHEAGWDAREISTFFHNRPSVPTVYRYVSEYESDSEHRVPEPLPRSNGRRCILTEGQAFVLWVAKNCMRTLSGRNCVRFLEVSAGVSVSRSTISRELVHRLGMSRQRLTSHSNKRDEEQRTSWWTAGPFDRPS